MAGAHRTKATIAVPISQPHLDQLAEFDLTLLPTGRSDEAAFQAALGDAEGLLVSSNVRLDRATIAAAPRLRMISTMSVGFDHIDIEAAREHGIVVTITPVLSDAVADLVMALMTMLARGIPRGMHTVASGGWRGDPLGGDLAGRVLLLVGFGRIGRAVATRALAAKMQVTYTDTRSDLADFDGAVRVDGLEVGLRQADVVSLHVDLNEHTHELMGRGEFALMKKTAYLVNTSRGGVVDQDALAVALQEGEIAGAALDVLRQEPPEADDPILEAPNVIILPHIGSATVETRSAMAQCAVDNLLAGLRPGSGPQSPSIVSG